MGDCYLVCLTGGIASGKTAVSKIIQKMDIPVIDTDILSREVVKFGSKGLAELVDFFGDSILKEDGTLDRSGLREKVFLEMESLKMLNKILHPKIRKLMIENINNQNAKIVVVVIPLFAGQKEYDFFDRICIIDVNEDVQLKRLTMRDGLNMAFAKKMVSSQLARSSRIALANDVIVNDSGLKELEGKVLQLFGFYQVESENKMRACHL